MSKIYIAAPVVGITDEQRSEINFVADQAATQLGEPAYKPWKLKIPNEWNMPMEEWARCVFTQDILALDEAAVVIVCDYGRHSSSGTAWEAGYAFAKGKWVVVVQMPGVAEVSLMVRNGCTVVVHYDDFIEGLWKFPNYREQYVPVVQN